MKRKSLLIVLLMAMLAPLALKAQTQNEILSENFDRMSEIPTSYSATGWYAYNAGNGNNWGLGTSSSYANSGSNCAQYQYNSANPANCYLVSSPFSVSRDMIELNVSLYERVRSSSYAESFEVFFVNATDVTTIEGVASATKYYAISEASYTNTSYAQVSGSINNLSLAGESLRVVVHCTSAKDKYYLYIDDITVNETIASGPYITLSPNEVTVTIGFTETITATYGNVNSTPRITYSSSNTRVATVRGDQTSAIVTGVSAGTATITATMSTDEGDYTATCSVTVEAPQYCTPAYSYSSTNYGMFIDGFSTEDGETDISNTGTSLSTGGYGDYYDSYSASAEAGQSFNFTVTPGSTVNPMKYGMWIDWNQDYDFDDDGENVAIQSSAIQTAWTGTVSIPSTTRPGSYRIRIEGMYSGDVELTPCINGTYGEAEDYQLIVLEASSCPKPSNLQLSALGNEITVTWGGDATSYNININGTVLPDPVTSPYVFTGELSTEYTIMVQSVCSATETSDWTNPKSVSTDACLFENQCPITITLTDAYGDGGGSMYVVDANAETILAELILSGSASQEFTVYVCHGTELDFYFYATDNYAYENGYVITDANGDVIAEHEGCASSSSCTAPTDGVVASYTMNCSSCTNPTALQANQIGTNSAMLSWTGENNSYLVHYRTAAHNNMNLWEQVGNDIIGTATLTQYTFDLSNYSGTGNIAIRHYNVSDMFRVAIDDIVVTDANGTEIVNEDFESSVPSDWEILDYDGDGYYWERAAFTENAGYQNGSYCISSESWVSGVGALTPDNWLIIPDVELGGTLTFYMRGVDASFPQENIGVFVTTESLETILAVTPAGNWSTDTPTTATSLELTGLTAGTEYEWQVKGICEGEESGWVTSYFSTLPEGFKVFVTEGNWNVADNWYPTGVPTITDEVSIEAAATIPAGVVATAKRVDLNGGSILIKDGGQLKQGAATLRVTVEKEITGYGSSTKDHYYFISSPFSGRTLYSASGTWSRVDNMLTGEYDLYAFDPTHELEWINYKASPTHISFESDNGNDGLMYGEGYLYANQEGTTLSFVGTTGKSIDYTETMEYTYDGESADDWNGWKLVGNFFSCDAYINYIDNEGNVLDADFYTMNNSSTYTLSESNVALAPCTGAFINYSATGKVQYSTEAPAKRSGMLNMNLTQGRGSVDQARVRFGNGYNLGKMSFRNDNAKLYIPQDNKEYAVVYAEAMGEMPVNFKAENNGSYTLSFNNENVEFSYLHLIDNLTGNDVDLLVNPSYSFDAKTTDYASRFKLVYSTGNSIDGNDFAFISNNSLKIFGIEGHATLKIMDITGRTLSTETFNGSYDRALNLSKGVYMLQLIQGSNVKNQKIVVK